MTRPRCWVCNGGLVDVACLLPVVRQVGTPGPKEFLICDLCVDAFQRQIASFLEYLAAAAPPVARKAQVDPPRDSWTYALACRDLAEDLRALVPRNEQVAAPLFEYQRRLLVGLLGEEFSRIETGSSAPFDFDEDPGA